MGLTTAKRAALWRIGIDTLKDSCAELYPDTKFGNCIDHLVLLGAAFALRDIGHAINANRLATYLEIPRETARRRLNNLIDKGLLAREPHGEIVLTAAAIKLNHRLEATFMRRMGNL